jgi:hypothetical protein
MPNIPQQHDAANKDPAKLLTHIFRGITGVYTSASRNAIPDDKVYYLENIIPIGDQNAVVVSDLVYTGVDFGPSNEDIYYSDSVNLNNLEYLVLFAKTGNVFLFRTDIGQAAKINPNNLQLSGANSRCAQWANNVILFIDHTGYYSYDGTTFEQITGPGVPLGGDDIEVYASRVWIVQGRVLFNSGAGDYTQSSFLPQNGAAFNVLIDPQIRSTVKRMKASGGFLYLYSDSGINAIFNVSVPIGAVPPTPTYSNQNIQPLIGTDQPASVCAFDQAMLFANKYGVYRLYGVSAPKLSDDINGTWKDVNFASKSISAGQVVIEGILCGAFLINRPPDPGFNNGTIIALWFQRDGKDCWFFANYGPLDFIVSAIVNGIATLYGYTNRRIYRLFASDFGLAPASTAVVTKLWPLEDDLAQKEAFRVGFLADITQYGSAITLSVDGLDASEDADITTAFAQGLWVNEDFVEGLWVDDAGLGIQGGWIGSGFQLISGKSPPMFGHNLGITLQTTRYKYTLNFMAIDYKLRDRWT